MLNDLQPGYFKHIYLMTGYTDLRRGIDSLAYLIQTEFRLDPYKPGNLFMFCGRRTDRIKCLTYEGDGWLLMYKRLSDGSFVWPRCEAEARNLSDQQLRWLMDGLSIDQKKVIRQVQPKLF